MNTLVKTEPTNGKHLYEYKVLAAEATTLLLNLTYAGNTTIIVKCQSEAEAGRPPAKTTMQEKGCATRPLNLNVKAGVSTLSIEFADGVIWHEHSMHGNATLLDANDTAVASVAGYIPPLTAFMAGVNIKPV